MRDGLFVESPVGMREVLYSPTGPVARHLIALGRAVQAAAKAQVGVKSGDLKASINVNFNIGEAGPEIMVGSDVPYGEYHHQPQPAFQIDGPLMVFQIGSDTVFTHHVDHPAWAGNPYLTKPMEEIVGGGLIGSLGRL